MTFGNYARFQVKIDIFRVISIIKDLTCLVGNSSENFMRNNMFDFNVLKFFGINTCRGKVLSPFRVQLEFSSPSWVKINTDGAVMGSPVLLPVVVFVVGVWENLLGVSLLSLMFRLLWLLSYGVIRVIEQTQKMDLSSLWLECDYVLVCVAFTTRTIVPWTLCNR